MSSPEFSSGRGHRSAPRKELQGPRPTALKVNKDSFRIKKPPIGEPPHQHNNPPPPVPAEDRQPVIIYAVSPKIIHTTVGDFMSLVQRLTGHSGTSSSNPTGSLSPAARLASIEKASPHIPKEPAGVVNPFDGDEISVEDLIGNSWVSLNDGIQGILSPAPTGLSPIPSGFFSPATDPSFNMFIASPGTLFSAPLVSPSPGSSPFGGLFNFNPLFDF